MKNLYFKTQVDGYFKDVYERFDRNLFEALKPPLIGLEVERFDGKSVSSEVHLKLNILGLTQKWVSLITESQINDEFCFFIDEGKSLPPPLKEWKHIHRVERIDHKSSYIIDDISYKCHGGIMSEIMMQPILYAQFSLRAPIYREYFASEK